MANTNETHPGGERTPPQRKKRRRRRNPFFHAIAIFFKVLGTILLLGVTTGAILACFAAVYINTNIIPRADLNLGELTVDMSLSSTMYYTDKATGELRELRGIYGGENRVWVGYDELPKYLIDATVAIEDKRFWDHHGVDWIRTGRGVLTMFTGEDIQGGSTITQQLIKNLTTDKEVTVQRKILEIFRALEFEKKYDKEQILEAYLNYIYLGEHSNGVYTASYAYFGKPVWDLSLAECASLISITNNPSIYNPYLSRRNADGTYNADWGRENNRDRALTVIKAMLEQEKISQAEYNQAKAELNAGLDFVRGEGEARVETAYTWYEDQVIEDVVNDLMEQKDYSYEVAINKVYHGGLTIETCLDPAVQAIVDGVYENMDNLPFISSSGQQLQSAIVIVDPEGNIVALSGGMGEKEGSRIFSRATTNRAPGSAFKPLSVYAPALDMGLITPGSVFDDSPYQLLGSSPYPSNSYLSYLGRMTVRDALTISSNAVAIKALALLTPQASFDFLTGRFGFTSLEAGRETKDGRTITDIALAPLSMGGLTDGVSVREMATAYSVFPRNGNYLPSRTYTYVKDSNGNILLDNVSERVPVPAVKDTTAWYINSMLKNVVSYNRVNGNIATGYEAILDGMTIAGKTGSTDKHRDRWFVGYSAYYTAAVWTGFDQQERIPDDGKGNPAAQIWKMVMAQVHEGLEDRDFPQPDGLVGVSICAESGMRSTDSCSMDPRGANIIKEYYFPNDVPSPFCMVHNQTPFPEGSLVTVCLDDPILNSRGEPTGMFHIAGEFCPDDRKSTICVMDFERERVSENYNIRDDFYTKDYLIQLGDAANCTVHTEPEPYDAGVFDKDDPSTWPTEQQWPGFDIQDPTTWPSLGTFDPAFYDPAIFDPDDMSTWPTQEQWPGFDPNDSATWPVPGGTAPGVTVPPVSPPPDTADPDAPSTPTPTPTPTPDPDAPPAPPDTAPVDPGIPVAPGGDGESVPSAEPPEEMPPDEPFIPAA